MTCACAAWATEEDPSWTASATRRTVLFFSGIRGLRWKWRPGFRPPASPDTEGDPAATQVVRGQFDRHPVAGDDLDPVLAHLPANVGDALAPAVQLDAELGVGQRLLPPPLGLDALFLRLVRHMSNVPWLGRRRVILWLHPDRPRAKAGRAGVARGTQGRTK